MHHLEARLAQDCVGTAVRARKQHVVGVVGDGFPLKVCRPSR